MRAPDETARADPWHVLLLVAALVVLVLTSFGGSLSNGFLNYDDPQYLTANPMVGSGLTWPGVKWAFTTFDAANWHPLTWVSHMLDVSLFGMDPRGHHAMSLGLHAVNGMLVFALLWAITRRLWPAWLGAALWAVHPLRVESVAWAAERKDVLSTMFGVLAVLAYVRWAQLKDVQQRDARRVALVYWASTAALALSLMAKPMFVTLPLILIALDITVLHRPCKQWLRMLIEKAPFALLAAASSVLTLQAQQAGGAMQAIDPLSLTVRLETALIAPVAYLWKTLWPRDLAILYPHPRDWPMEWVVGAGIAMTLMMAAVWLLRRRAAGLIAGWGWYLIALLPVVGLVQVGRQWIADRYTYVPAIGLSLLLAGLCGVIVRKQLRIAATLMLLAITFVLAGVTSRHVAVFRDSKSVFAHALEVQENNALAHHNLGEALLREGSLADAQRHFQRAVEVDPNYATARNSFGNALMMQGDTTAALEHLREAVRLRPSYPEAHAALGLCLAAQRRFSESREHLEQAVRLNPRLPQANLILAQVLVETGNFDEAKMAAERELQIVPGNSDATRLLEMIRSRQRR